MTITPGMVMAAVLAGGVALAALVIVGAVRYLRAAGLARDDRQKRRRF